MADHQENGTAIFNGIAERLLDTLGLLTQPYVPSEAERRHLEAALVHLIAAFDSRDFEPGEEAVWNCGSIRIVGQERGAWEIALRQTDALASGMPLSEDPEEGLRPKAGSPTLEEGDAQGTPHE